MKLRALAVVCVPFALLLGLGRLPLAPSAAADEAEQKVSAALADYEAGDYASAARGYEEADATLPNHPWILFDLATVLAAQGQTARAEALFEKVAGLADQAVAARARYNLGCLAAEKAAALLGDRPESAPPDVTKQGMDLLDRAAAQYRDCLRLDQGHADARHNLEIIRLFAARMRKARRDRDPPQPDPAAPSKKPLEKQPAEEPAKKGPGEKGTKPDPPGGSADNQKPPPTDERPKAAGEAAPPLPGPSPIAETDPASQQAQRLIDRVRQRSLEKRQWDRRHQSGSWTQVEEKSW